MEIKGRPLDERMFRRQEESVPPLNELFNVCSAIQAAPLFLPKSPLGQAVAYALKNETALHADCKVVKFLFFIDRKLQKWAV